MLLMQTERKQRTYIVTNPRDRYAVTLRKLGGKGISHVPN